MTVKMSDLKIILLVVLMGVIWPSEGQETIKIGQLTEPINFDGIPDEGAWQSATSFDLLVHSPAYGDQPSENSQVYIIYDKTYLWVAAKLHYKDPSTIASTSKKRDEVSKNPDSFGIILDTYNDNESGSAFFTMPAGQRIDYSIANDAMGIPAEFGASNINYSWNTFWDVKTARLVDGWSVEMRIPFSSLRFQVMEGKVTMGLLINRKISYCNEMDTYPLIDPKYGRNAMTKPSLAVDIVFQGIKESKPIYLSPYVIGGIERQRELNESETAIDYSSKNPLTGGLDAKFSLTSNLTLDVTLNTDFAQVEADDEKVNTTPYSLFFPEKRMFFQERSSIFSFNLGETNDLFYSRRIGVEEGIPTPILGGARVTGKIGNWELGVMDMQTGEKDETVSENFGVLRVRRQVINPNSYVGGIFTSRVGTNGKSYLSYGADGIFRIFGDDYLKVKLAQTTNGEDEDLSVSPKSMFSTINLKRRTQRGVAYDLTYTYSGEDFDPQIGYLKRIGVQGFNLRGQYGWIPGKESILFRYRVSFTYAMLRRLADNSLESGSIGPRFNVSTKSGWAGRLEVFGRSQGVFDEEYSITDDVFVPIGEYSTWDVSLGINSPVSKPFSTELSFESGTYFDGTSLSATAEPTVNLSASLQFSGYYNFNHIVFENRGQELFAHVGRLKLLYMYNTKLSVGSYIQYNSVNHMAIANFRLRFNPKEGNDLYVVYNETRPTSGYFPEGVSKVRFLGRVLQLKYIHTFRVKS